MGGGLRYFSPEFGGISRFSVNGRRQLGAYGGKRRHEDFENHSRHLKVPDFSPHTKLFRTIDARSHSEAKGVKKPLGSDQKEARSGKKGE